MNEELKPCPFCGNFEEPDLYCLNSAYSLVCSKCNSSTGYYDFKEETIKAWNNRVESTELKETKRKLKITEKALYDKCVRISYLESADNFQADLCKARRNFLEGLKQAEKELSEVKND